MYKGAVTAGGDEKVIRRNGGDWLLIDAFKDRADRLIFE